MLRLTLGGLGATIRLRVSGDRRHELRDALRVAWSRCLVGGQGPEAAPVSLAFGDGLPAVGGRTPQVTGPALGPLLQLATQSITMSLIEAQAGNALMLHAAAICNDSGRSLVCVAPGGTGKTSFARLMGLSYGYITDETAAIAPGGTIHPYPKPLSLRVPDQGHKSEASPDALGLLHCPPAPTLARMVLLQRQDSADSVTIEELGLLEGIAALAPESSSLSRLDRGLHQLAALIESTGPVERWVYRDAESLRPQVERLIGPGA